MLCIGAGLGEFHLCVCFPSDRLITAHQRVVYLQSELEGYWLDWVGMRCVIGGVGSARVG